MTNYIEPLRRTQDFAAFQGRSKKIERKYALKFKIFSLLIIVVTIILYWVTQLVEFGLFIFILSFGAMGFALLQGYGDAMTANNRRFVADNLAVFKGVFSTFIASLDEMIVGDKPFRFVGSKAALIDTFYLPFPDERTIRLKFLLDYEGIPLLLRADFRLSSDLDALTVRQYDFEPIDKAQAAKLLQHKPDIYESHFNTGLYNTVH